MTLQERVDAQLADIDAQIENEKKRSAEKLASLLNRRAVLRQASTIITPQLEQTVVALQKIGLIDAL
jgi:multidrug resistance efflux pump